MKNSSATVEEAMKFVFLHAISFQCSPFNILSIRVIHGFEDDPGMVEGILLGHIKDGNDYIDYL